jgi:hypothetical protein
MTNAIDSVIGETTKENATQSHARRSYLRPGDEHLHEQDEPTRDIHRVDIVQHFGTMSRREKSEWTGDVQH